MRYINPELASRVQSELFAFGPASFAKSEGKSRKHKWCHPPSYLDFVGKIDSLIQTIKIL